MGSAAWPPCCLLSSDMLPQREFTEEGNKDEAKANFKRAVNLYDKGINGWGDIHGVMLNSRI